MAEERHDINATNGNRHSKSSDTMANKQKLQATKNTTSHKSKQYLAFVRSESVALIKYHKVGALHKANQISPSSSDGLKQQQ